MSNKHEIYRSKTRVIWRKISNHTQPTGKIKFPECRLVAGSPNILRNRTVVTTTEIVRDDDSAAEYGQIPPLDRGSLPPRDDLFSEEDLQRRR